MNELMCKGLTCPMPIVKTATFLSKADAGDTVVVVADDPGFERDIQAWCRNTGNTLRSLEKDGSVIKATIVKA